MVPVMMTKATFRTAPGAMPAISAPTPTPTTDGIAQARTTSISTAPCARCTRYERTLVGTMIAIEVPTQSCMRTSSGTSSTRNTS